MIPTNRYNRFQQQQRSRKFVLPNNHGSFFKIAVCLVIGLVLGGTISLLCFWTLGNADEMFGEQVSVAHAVLRRSSTTKEASVPRIEGNTHTTSQEQEQHYNIRGVVVKEQPVPAWKRTKEEPAAAAAVAENKKQRTIPFQRKRDQTMNDKKNKDPMSVDQVIDFLSNYLHLLHEKMVSFKDTKTHFDIWEAFHEITKQTLYPWDLEYLINMPRRRQDGSIFLSLASYRDENCVNTLSGAFENAKHPSQLFVGLVQQNCISNCQSGVLEGGKVVNVEPDVDCHAEFCLSEIGKPHCEAGRVRALHINESESLGPYMARYFASKLWSGEEWFLQVDAHMSFAQNWDTDTIVMLEAAPSTKPVISHYPPDKDTNFEKAKHMPAPRICVPEFADSGIEEHIVRLEGSGVYDHDRIDTPRFAPFVAAGYFAAHSDFLKEVPFDPFLPWIFMGEEIIMSARLWTSGYDIFSPTHSVLGHIYVRRHKPKFWESVGRLFQPGIHNPLQRLVLQRVKTQLLYPESQPDELKTKSLLFALENYTMGTERSLEDYLEMVGLDPKTKKVTNTKWCQQGMPPTQFQHLNHLYQLARKPDSENLKNIPHTDKADVVHVELGDEEDKTANKKRADHKDPEGKDKVGVAANGDAEEAKDNAKVQEENATEKVGGGGKAGDAEERNKDASEPSDDDDDDDTEEKPEEKESSDEQVTDGDAQASDTEKEAEDAKEPTGDDDDKEEQSVAKEENVVGDMEEQANEQDGQASDTEEGDEDAEEPTDDDDDSEEQVKEEDGQVSDTEKQAKEEDGQASDTEEQAKEEDGQASDTEEQAKEKDGQASDTEEQAKEEDGHASDMEEQAKEEDGQGSDTEEQAKEEDGHASDTEEQAKQGDGGVDGEEGGGNDTEGSKDGEPDGKQAEEGDDNDTDQEAGAGDDDAEGQEEGGDDDAEGQEEQAKAADVEAKPEAIERRALLKNRVKLEVDD